MKIMLPLLAAALTAMCPAQSWAATLLYKLTSQAANGYSASWTMAKNPTPTQSVSGEGFAIERVIGTFPRTTEGDAYIDFFFAANSGGLMISDADGPRILTTLYGEQLYTGDEATPTMRTGIFTLTSSPRGGRLFSLSVADVAATVPEPGTWILMLAGFGMIGATVRRHRRIAVRYV